MTKLLNQTEELLESRELKENTIGDIISTGTMIAGLAPVAAGVLTVLFGVTDLSKALSIFKKKDEVELKPLDRVKVKLAKAIDNDSNFYNKALSKIVSDKTLKSLNDVALDMGKNLKLSKEEFVSLHDHLFELRNKIINVKPLTNH